MHYELKKEKVLEFMKSGRAILTAKNTLTDNHKTFLIDRSKDHKVFFVRIRGDQDSTLANKKNWVRVGMIIQGQFRLTKGSQVDSWSVSFKSFDWLYKTAIKWSEGQDDYPRIQVYHEGHCGRCGRVLTDPASIERGYGPECIKKVIGG